MGQMSEWTAPMLLAGALALLVFVRTLPRITRRDIPWRWSRGPFALSAPGCILVGVAFWCAATGHVPLEWLLVLYSAGFWSCALSVFLFPDAILPLPPADPWRHRPATRKEKLALATTGAVRAAIAVVAIVWVALLTYFALLRP